MSVEHLNKHLSPAILPALCYFSLWLRPPLTSSLRCPVACQTSPHGCLLVFQFYMPKTEVWFCPLFPTHQVFYLNSLYYPVHWARYLGTVLYFSPAMSFHIHCVGKLGLARLGLFGGAWVYLDAREESPGQVPQGARMGICLFSFLTKIHSLQKFTSQSYTTGAEERGKRTSSRDTDLPGNPPSNLGWPTGSSPPFHGLGCSFPPNPNPLFCSHSTLALGTGFLRIFFS